MVKIILSSEFGSEKSTSTKTSLLLITENPVSDDYNSITQFVSSITCSISDTKNLYNQVHLDTNVNQQDDSGVWQDFSQTDVILYFSPAK